MLTKGRGTFFAVLVLCAAQGTAQADSITFSGLITQSTQDGTGPAMNNPALNSIQDGDAFTVTLSFPGSIIPSLISGPNLSFVDTTNAAVENAFVLESVSVVGNGPFDDFSILGCLSTGSGCAFGNQLTANFEILAASLHLQDVAATGLDQPHPLDLLEDDGTTDIHGSISSYSYTSAVPEPASRTLLALALLVLALSRRWVPIARKEEKANL